MMHRIGIIQFCASDQPDENLAELTRLIEQAVAKGAEIIFTPEVVNCLSESRQHQTDVLCLPQDDPMLSACCDLARHHGVEIALGSLAQKTTDPDGRFVNRSYLIDAKGQIVDYYDKIHMFDVTISATETYRESAGYKPGTRAVIADSVLGKLGMAICYDVRFPHLFRGLAKAGAKVIAVPAAFSPVSGAAHWHALLRARAIETGCFIVAAAQAGKHGASVGKSRETYGHSLIVNPWGKIIFDALGVLGVSVVDIDLEEVNTARNRIPSITHDKPYTGP